MPDTHGDYPLAEVLDDGDVIHHARPVGRFGSRVETRCGLQGRKTGRDGGTWCPECKALARDEASNRDESATPACSTPCDPDCNAVCHEDHVAGHKKQHWPYDCPAADEYFWDGDQFTADAIKRLRGERDDARQQLIEVERLRGQQFEGSEQHDHWIIEFRRLHADVGNITWTDVDRDTADTMISHYQRTSQLLNAYLAIRSILARSEAETAKLRAQLAVAGEMRDALAVSMELLDRLADDGPCQLGHHGYCQGHSLHEAPCPHPLARQMVAAWREVEREVPDA